MDPADITKARRLKAAWDEAQAGADARKAEFFAFVAELYARKRSGDVRQLAEALGRTAKQVKRWADGRTSGNR